MRIRNNEIGLFFTTLSDFDKFPLVNDQKRIRLRYNHGSGIEYKRILPKNYLLTFSYSDWGALAKSPVSFGMAYYKWADLYTLGVGKRIYHKGNITFSPEVQIIFRKGGMYTYENQVLDLRFSRFYSDWGGTAGFDFNFKLFRFLALNLKSYFSYYFYVNDRTRNIYNSNKPYLSRQSLIINLGFKVLF